MEKKERETIDLKFVASDLNDDDHPLKDERIGAVFQKQVFSCIAGSDLFQQTELAKQVAAKVIGKGGDTIWVDGRLGKYHTSLAQRTILEMAGSERPGSLKCYDLYHASREQMLTTIERLASTDRPDLLVINGVRHLIFDIHSLPASEEIITFLYKWSAVYGCHVLVVYWDSDFDVEEHAVLPKLLKKHSELFINIQNHQAYQYDV